MRRFVMLILLLGLAGCQIGGGIGKAKPAPNALTGGEIEVTALDGGAKPVPPAKPDVTAEPPQGKPAADTPSPAEPEKAAAADPAKAISDAVKTDPTKAVPEPEPAKPKSAPQMACEKKGGKWGFAGKSGASTCIKSTGEGAKQCSRQTDCKGSCLARSGTCAPYTPLFGCNEILQADGSRVTLCID